MLMSMRYLPRIIDRELSSRLRSSPIVVIEGAKACGKTETALQMAKSSVRLDTDEEARRAAALDPKLVLSGEVPRLIDEWQVEPSIWNHARRVVDTRRSPGQFILTGSSAPADDPVRHSGAGRFSFIRMRPMSLYESGQSTGGVSLMALFEGEGVRSAEAPLTVAELAELVARGGWPAQLDAAVGDAAQAASDYLAQTAHVDVSRVGGVRRDPVRVRRLFASLARNVATEVALSTLADDSSGPGEKMSRQTAAEYLEVLNQLMVIEDQPAWSAHLRSKATLRRAPKRHFVDPSLAAAALSALPARLESDLGYLGLLFESLVVRDLRILAQPIDGEVFHYRDDRGREVDAVVQLADGRWAAFEVKLGGTAAINAAASSLLRFASDVDIIRSGAPAVLAVITMSGYGYVRDDGVAVIPIRSLAP